MMEIELPLARRYERFRADVFGGLGEKTTLPGWSEPLPELRLQALWYGGDFGSSFAGTDGQQVQIRDFGIWNAGAGPDFTGCTVILDGKQLSGDIEIDPDVRDWERHQHGANPDFNRVVLHVFVTAPAEARLFTRTSEHKEVAQVLLPPELLAAMDGKPRAPAPARLGRCATPLSEMSALSVASLLESSAQYRLQRKATRLHRGVAAHGREQAVYQALAQALGYRNNQQAFVLLAQRLPLRSLLRKESSEREALLFGVGGFLSSIPFDQSKDATRDYLRSLWEHWWKLSGEFARWAERGFDVKWNLKATRPGNHPQRRLGALAAMLSAWPRVMGPLKRAGAWHRDTWTETLEGLAHPYWSHHYTLTAAPAARPVALVGGTRVQEMLANVVYPLLVPERPGLWAEYLELPALLENQTVRRAALRLFGESPVAKQFQNRLHHQQGLIQLYEDFCLEDDSACAGCPFPERLKQWS